MTRPAIALAMLLAASCNRNREASSVPALIPAQAIGPVTLGMAQTLVVALRLPAALYQIDYAASRVSAVTYRLTRSRAGLTFDGQPIPSTVTLSELLRILPGCGPPSVTELGLTVQCGPRTTLHVVAEQIEVRVGT